MTSRFPSWLTARSSRVPQSETHKRPACHLGDSPKVRFVKRRCGSGFGLNPYHRTEIDVNFSKISYIRNRQGEERCKNESTAASLNWMSCARLVWDKNVLLKHVENMALLRVSFRVGEKSIRSEENPHFSLCRQKGQPHKISGLPNSNSFVGSLPWRIRCEKKHCSVWNHGAPCDDYIGAPR